MFQAIFLELGIMCKDALRDFFLKESGDNHKDKDLPFRLCTIEQNGPNDWKVTGFISDLFQKLCKTGLG